MWRITAVLACACAALTLAGGASSTTFGVADDAGKYSDDSGGTFFHMLTDLGMTENRMAVFWDPTQPNTIVDQAFLDRSLPQAMRRGIEVIFAIYPEKARSLVDTPNGVELFAQYAARVVQRYPYVRKVICLNEGNQPRFHQPQFDDSGKGISGYVQEQAMAACYDAVKAVDPKITVIAFGLSPRGNDDFEASSNVSHSPIRFLEEVGEAYRASGRTKPIADEVSIHCYPNLNTDAPTVGYAWPKIGCANFDRFKQAWWDAFHGTAQPVFREAGDSGPGPYVHIYVDEVGYQAKIAPEKASLYTGSENVPVLDEATQGNYYAQLIAMMACDPNVALLNFFHAVDETSLPAWQSGLVLPDGTRRASFTAVRDAIMANQECKGKLVEWRHTDRVVGAGVSFKTLPRSFLVRADEGFSYEVKITRTSSTRRLTGAVGQGEAARDLLFKLPRLGRGTYRVTVTLHAETNAQRVTTFSRTFRRYAPDMSDLAAFKAAGMRYKNRHDRSARGEAGRPARQLLSGAATGPDRPARRRHGRGPVRAGALPLGVARGRQSPHARRGRRTGRDRGGRGDGGAADVRLRDRSFRDRERRPDRHHLG